MRDLQSVWTAAERVERVNRRLVPRGMPVVNYSFNRDVAAVPLDGA